jgi:hypothetical protein
LVPKLAGLALAAAGLGWLLARDGNVRYLEQVQLSSGEIIQVERVIEPRSIGNIGGPGGWEAIHNSLTVVAAAIPVPPTWESETGLMPMLIDRDPESGDWYLAATFYTCASWRANGRPKLPYVAFRGAREGWTRIAIAPQLIGREANVLTRISSKGESSPVTLADKKERNSDTRIALRYLRILDHWTSSC